jgi:RNA polymerase sigma-70 factor (ECF subfamily)
MLDFRGTLEGAQHGDEEAFARLWREFHPGLLRYLRIKAAPVSEDLAADIWVRVLRALPNYTTARNRLTDWYRSGERRIDVIEHASLIVLPSANNVEDEAAENSATDRAIALIAELPPDQAEAVMLRIVVGMDVARVATIMERTPGSIRVLCHRGLRRLEQRLAEVVAAESVRAEIPDLVPTTVTVGSATVPDRTEERLHA